MNPNLRALKAEVLARLDDFNAAIRAYGNAGGTQEDILPLIMQALTGQG